jgi:hypothetical protein
MAGRSDNSLRIDQRKKQHPEDKVRDEGKPWKMKSIRVNRRRYEERRQNACATFRA